MHHALPSRRGICLPAMACACALFPFRAGLSSPRPHSSVLPEHRIFHLYSIAYAFPPRLRSRLTQGRSALPWNPRTSGLDDSHIHLATHSGILSSMLSTTLFSMASSCIQCSPTSPDIPQDFVLHGFGGMFQPRVFSARGLSASELLRTL